MQIKKKKKKKSDKILGRLVQWNHRVQEKQATLKVSIKFLMIATN
jgi:hypothetical protein